MGPTTEELWIDSRQGQDISIMKQQLVVTHRYTVLQETEKKLDRSLTYQNLSMLCFYENIRTSNFFGGHNILIEGVFVTRLSRNAGISV
jgi:hypothetical protein